MENYLIYIPKDYRQHNLRASCVIASVVNGMRFVHLFDEADKFWATYKGDWNGESAGSIGNKLDRFHIKYKILKSEAEMLESLSAGRGAAVTWHGKHCVNLVGRINNNAYIIDNESPKKYSIQPWQQFLTSWRRSGGWGVIILSGKPSKPIDRKTIEGFE